MEVDINRKTIASLTAALLGIGAGVGSFARDGVDRAQVKEMISEAPPIVAMKKDIEALSSTVERNHVDTTKQLDAILKKIEEHMRGDRR